MSKRVLEYVFENDKLYEIPIDEMKYNKYAKIRTYLRELEITKVLIDIIVMYVIETKKIEYTITNSKNFFNKNVIQINVENKFIIEKSPYSSVFIQFKNNECIIKDDMKTDTAVWYNSNMLYKYLNIYYKIEAERLEEKYKSVVNCYDYNYTLCVEKVKVIKSIEYYIFEKIIDSRRDITYISKTEKTRELMYLIYYLIMYKL